MEDSESCISCLGNANVSQSSASNSGFIPFSVEGWLLLDAASAPWEKGSLCQHGGYITITALLNPSAVIPLYPKQSVETASK